MVKTIGTAFNSTFRNDINANFTEHENEINGLNARVTTAENDLNVAEETLAAYMAEIIAARTTLDGISKPSLKAALDWIYLNGAGDGSGGSGTGGVRTDLVVPGETTNYEITINENGAIVTTPTTKAPSVYNNATIETKVFIATEGQTVFDISDVGSYLIGSNRLTVSVGIAEQKLNEGFSETTATTFTLSQGVSAGTKVYAKWFQGGVNLQEPHSVSHKAGGSDELNIEDLAGYQTIVDSIETLTDEIETVVKYPVLSIETGKVVNKDYPYCHVDRYGGDPTGVNDSTTAIQTAYDIHEELAKGTTVHPKGYLPVQFSFGSYLITKTIRVKYDAVLARKQRPVSFIGVPRKKTGDEIGKGTMIRPLIPNHTGKTYAVAFAINVKYNSDIDEDDTMVFAPEDSIDNIKFENIAFTLDPTESQTYNICAVKCYRTRLDMRQMVFNGMWRGIWQPRADRLGNTNYCDFSNFEDFSFSNLKHIGAELDTPDNTSIRRWICHTIKSSFDSVLKITYGGGITINNFQAAYHGDYSTEAGFTPRNDGTGLTGPKAYIKLIGTTGVTLDGQYMERPLGDFFLYLNGAINVKIMNYYERFFGNGFINFYGTCRNIEVDNIYRHSNLVSEYNDFNLATGAKVMNLTVRNFLPRNWYSEVINLATTDFSSLTKISDSTFTTRDLKHNFTTSNYQNFTGEEIAFKIQYDGTNWLVRDRNDVDISSAIGTITWNTDGIDLSATKLHPVKVIAVQEGYISATSLAHVPVFRGISSDKIRFFDRSTGQAISSPDTKCCVYLTVNSLYNTAKLPM